MAATAGQLGAAGPAGSGPSDAPGRWRARVLVTLKEGVLDPQGRAVQASLTALGYQEVAEVRVGKLIELVLAGPRTAEAAREAVETMCRRLLANPVAEQYEVELAKEDG